MTGSGLFYGSEKTMTEYLKTLLSNLDEKHKAQSALLQNIHTGEELKQAEDNAKELKDLEIQVAHARSAEGLKSQNDDLAKRLATPTNVLPIQGQETVDVRTLLGKIGGEFGNGVKLLGFTQENEVQVTRRGLGFEVEGLKDVKFKEGAFRACVTAEYEKVYRKFLTHKGGFGILTHEEQKTINEGIDTDGGYLAPEQVLNRIIQRRPTPTRLYGMCDQLTISRDGVTFPRQTYSTDDLYTTPIRATWVGETTTAAAHRTSTPQWGQVRIPVYTAMLSLAITNSMIEDGMIDILAWISGKFDETIELLRDNMIVNGNGIMQPSGILVNPGTAYNPAVINSGDASLLTGDGLIDLTEDLPEQYDENARLIFNKTNTGKKIRMLKDGDGRPLVSYGAADFGLAGGRYKEVNGYPYTWSGFMPNVSANTYPIIFGDLKGYLCVDRVGFSTQIIDQPYAEQDMKVILGRIRFGGQVVEDWRLRIHKISA